MKQFMDKDFLLSTQSAKDLYHNYAAKMPIVDYHCHINPQEIYEDRKFDTITQVWLGGDHYKWRQMRSNGVEEKYITGDATDREKFQKWAGNHAKAHWEPSLSLEPFGTSEIFWLHRLLKWRYSRRSLEFMQRKASSGFHECA